MCKIKQSKSMCTQHGQLCTACNKVARSVLVMYMSIPAYMLHSHTVQKDMKMHTPVFIPHPCVQFDCAAWVINYATVIPACCYLFLLANSNEIQVGYTVHLCIHSFGDAHTCCNHFRLGLGISGQHQAGAVTQCELLCNVQCLEVLCFAWCWGHCCLFGPKQSVDGG